MADSTSVGVLTNIFTAPQNAFAAIKDGRKRFEWRRDDRGYEVGDVLLLREWDPVTKDFVDVSGDFDAPFVANEMRVRVTYILRGAFGIPPNYCVMSIEPETSNG